MMSLADLSKTLSQTTHLLIHAESQLLSTTVKSHRFYAVMKTYAPEKGNQTSFYIIRWNISFFKGNKVNHCAIYFLTALTLFKRNANNQLYTFITSENKRCTLCAEDSTCERLKRVACMHIIKKNVFNVTCKLYGHLFHNQGKNKALLEHLIICFSVILLKGLFFVKVKNVHQFLWWSIRSLDDQTNFLFSHRSE